MIWRSAFSGTPPSPNRASWNSFISNLSPSYALLGVGEVHATLTHRGLWANDFYVLARNDSDAVKLIRGFTTTAAESR